MKCPYTINIKQSFTKVYDYDEDGRIIKESSDLFEVHSPIKCSGQDCGAFIEGKCRYASVFLNND